MTAEVSEALRLGVAAFLVGLSGAMSPGSYLTVTVTRTLRRGPGSAALMLVGHALLEAALLIGFAFGLAGLLRSDGVIAALSLVGSLVLLWMGSGLMRGSISGSIVADLEAAGGQALSGHPAAAVAQGAVVSLSNPYWTLWWATIGVRLAADGIAIGPIGVLAFFLGHQLADVSWYTLVIAAVHRGTRVLGPRAYRAVMGVLATFLLYMGVRFALEPFGVHLPWLPF